MGIRINPESLSRIKRKVRHLTRRNQGRSWAEIRDQLQITIRGWVNYYALADAKRHMERMDEWLRRRMRQMAWKQWKTPRNRYKQLKSRGVSEFWAIRLGGSSLGPWRIANASALIYALDNAYWRRVGLVSFLQLYTLRHT